MKYIIFLWLCLNITFSLSGQHKSWKHFTISDGLPTKAVWDIVQAKNGYLWFSTMKGLCRYDGYDFNLPVDTSVYAQSEAFFPVEDPQGRIWFARLDNSIWFVEKDTVRSWVFNNVLHDYSKDMGLMDRFWIDEDNSFWIDLASKGLLMIDKEGRSTQLRGSSYYNFVFFKNKNTVYYATQSALDNYKSPLLSPLKIDIRYWDGISMLHVDEYIHSDFSNQIYMSAWTHRDSVIVLAYDRQFHIVQNGQIVDHFQTSISSPLLEFSVDGGVFAGSYREATGLFYYPTWSEFRLDRGQTILHEKRIYDILTDSEGGLWVACDDGLFYCSNPEMDVYSTDSGLPADEIMEIVYDNHGTIIAGDASNSLSGINLNTGKISLLGNDVVREWTDMWYDKDRQMLWCATYLTCFNGKYQKKDFDINVKRIHASTQKDKLWLSSTFGFYTIDLRSLEIKRFQEDETPMRTFAVLGDQNDRVWVATVSGLKIWKDNQYTDPPFTNAVLSHQVRDILLLSDSTIVFGFADGGVLIYQKDLQQIHLTSQQGLSSNFIYRLKNGVNNQFFACTDMGLNKIYPDSTRNWKVEVINMKHGLPSGVVHDVMSLEEDLWIATDRGLTRIKNDIPEIRIPMPVIEGVRANNKPVILREHTKLNYQENNISISFHSLHFKSGGDILYKYRLTGADTAFTVTRQRHVNFPVLSPGEYTFEVQAQNSDGTWTLPARKSFEILPPWYKSQWFLLASLASVVTGIYFFFKARMHSIREKAETVSKIKELEMSALRAQMNPHFIFNCLGSIQQFIAENDGDSATRYLARFAKLVRLALHSSVDGKHSLTEEVEMLDNYLALEQMRFKGRFKYEILLHDIEDANELTIPPLLIQPFVENSILHGLKNKNEAGHLLIEFTSLWNVLDVTITDNGSGDFQNSQNVKSDHKSVGMMLTRKRFDLLSKSSGAITRENLVDEAGRPAGFRVKVSIPVN